ncbi:hypothetical protein NEAUS04_0715 [Nematocida ausubeli]|nr:hypothetical protein NEAUS07_0899 [Nematocida ausubeli]KAI5161795.1 hypothetical protein NEAUS04_0715 [Nematocida ausubeli]
MLSILSFVFFERLAFYSIKSHLFMYIVQYMGYNRMDGIIYVHSFIFLSYLCCIMCGFIADRYVGQYLMISISLATYILGTLSITVSSVARSNLFFAAGVLCVAFSAGGIKPNISSSGAGIVQSIHAAKIAAHKTVQTINSLIVTFFSQFYFVINLSSFIVLFITPATVSRLLCTLMGSNSFSRGSLHQADISEYFLVFAFSSVSIFISIILFSALMAQCILRYIFVPKFSVLQEEKSQSDSHPYSIVQSLPIIIGWAIYDQMSSTWIDQGKRMLSTVHILSYSAHILPSQMILINSFLLMVFLPFYNPAMTWLFSIVPLRDTPRHRMSYGLFLIGISYIVYYMIELYLLHKGPISILFQVPQILIITLGEALISVSGMTLAYNDGTSDSKSMAMGYWYFNIALGNLLVICISALYKSMGLQIAHQGILYICLIFIAMVRSLQETANNIPARCDAVLLPICTSRLQPEHVQSIVM